MGYTTGFIAEVFAILLAGRAMGDSRRLGLLAAGAGFAAGFAMWSHPMYGLVAGLALLPPCFVNWRRLGQWWIPLVVAGIDPTDVWKTDRSPARYAVGSHSA